MNPQPITDNREPTMLNHRDAYDVFANADMRQSIEVISRHTAAYKGDEGQYREIRLLLVALKTYLYYRSDEMREIVQGLCARFLADIYRHKKVAGYEELAPLCSVVLFYRHVPRLSALKKWPREEQFIASWRERWRKLGHLPVEV